MILRRMEINWLCSLHIAQSCRRLCCLQRLIIKHQRSMLSILHQPIVIVHKCPNSIHRVQWCIPSLRTLLLQEPTLHLNKRLTISRSNRLYRLNSSHLCWNLIITPAVISVFRIEITSLLLRINRIFLDTLEIFVRLFHLTILLEDYCSICLTIDSQVRRLLSQAVDEVLYVICSSVVIEQSIGVEIITKLIRWEEYRIILLLITLHFSHTLSYLLIHKAERSVNHVRYLWAWTCKVLQTSECLRHRNSHIKTSLHSLPPRERTIRVL